MKRGVTLIELLVAMAIATLVGYIAFDLVRDEQGNYTKTRTKVRLQADARDAVRILEEDFANLGFRQGLRSGAMPVGADLKRICLSGIDTVLRPDQRLFVFDDGGNGSDTIEGRFFRVSPTEGVQCAISPIRVRYFVRGTQLIRQFWNAGDSVNVRSEAVVLEDVVTMQAQAATDTLLTNQLPSVRPKNHLLEDAKLSPVVTGDLTPTSDTIAHGTTGDTLVGWRGWGTSPRELKSGLGQKLMSDATYRLSCMIQMDPVFHDAYTSLTDTGFLQIIVRSQTVWADTLDVRFPPHSDIPFWVSWEFQPRDISAGSDIRFGLRARVAVPNTAAKLHVGSIHVTRVAGAPIDLDDAPQWFWRDAVKVNPAQDSMFRARTEGLKVWLVTKSRRGNREGSQQAFNGIGNWSENGKTPTDPNSYAIFERILPVVHHGF